MSYTTIESSPHFAEERYNHISESEFLAMCQRGEMFESTNYANHYYGSRKADVEAILARGHHAVTVMDICGAMALKTHFPNVVTVYIKRNKRDLLTSIVTKDIAVNDKVNRLLALETERHNAAVCDYMIEVETCEQAVQQICKSLNL